MLKDKVALVTGASRGIGRAIALRLAQDGAKIIVNYAASDAAANEVVEQIKSMGGEAIAVKAAIGNEEETKTMIEAAEKAFGGIDILVNNAGITRDNLLMRMKTEEWDDVINTNLKGTYLAIRHVVRGMMKKRYGKIINITSVVGFTGNAGQVNYTASKGGVISMTKTVAQELASRGIRVNAVAPGFIQTDMTDVLSDDVKNAMLERIPLASLGNPSDIAEAVAYLASPASDYVTGQVIHVNGGMYM